MAKEAAVPLTRQTSSSNEEKPGLPSVGNIAVKCPKCKEILYSRDWEKNLKVCSRCNHHFRLTAYERIELLADPGSFHELDADIISVDPLQFTTFPPAHADQRNYGEKLAAERKKTGMNEAVVIGHSTVESKPLAMAVMDFHFMGGSMGSAVGEKITRAIELGIERNIPVLIASTSGGARMQEGLFSLMQMAKTSAALAKLGEKKLPYISLLTDPTTGGVSASFAMLGDITLAEPGALVCFTGPRVIEQFMHIKLPEGTVNSEFGLQHGMIDAVVHRRDLRSTLGRILRLYA
ncbi:acetyl-coenzyme A carboxylase carboxyl transferase subunit beta [Dictyobacter vulcani]|uniref:Acetyl-coenzyme A carboxylase carboxyl transferase subunit beta n=1 Tax=Dictyobacter vulcani TaxID=2607529 RepID=A0A5J4KCG2_9CHLR|nr:acetyl-CoA carboxylase, carboxyltransferase subunit beta [Dictyobacter vulcani]GER86428.1 acetyl-coenzyme A carboxylase carboxyl transferase subunit beta [Dictyobacter vulcani]